MNNNTIINNSINANRNNTYKNNLLEEFIKAINSTKDLLIKTQEIDITNNNGFKLDFDAIDKILDRYKNKKQLINSENIINKKDNVLISKLYEKLGIILVIFDGNPYVLIEMIILSILTHNTVIFSYDGYMRGTNNLIINLIQSIYDKEQLNKNTIQLYETNNNKNLFKNFKTINKTIIIGDNQLINKNIKECTTEVITSGYNNYDLYIESLDHKDIIENILKQNLNINVYFIF